MPRKGSSSIQDSTLRAFSLSRAWSIAFMTLGFVLFVFRVSCFSVGKTKGLCFRSICKELYLNVYLLLHCYWLYKYTNIKWYCATQSTKIINYF